MNEYLQTLNEYFILIDSYIGSAPWFPYLLLGAGLFFTIYLRFPQFRYFGHAIRVVRGKYDKKGDAGDTSHFQALTTALSGTVGTGNIAGVAFAIHLGGPAALFWMLVTAFFGMTTKFVEVTLSHKYREHAQDGSIAGGPMYFMKNKLKMPWMAAIFAVATVLSSFGTGNLPQVNGIASSMFSTFGINKMVTGAVLAVLLAFVIIGGIKRIAQVTERLVPAMALIYFVGALMVIFYNIENIVPSFISIFADVFTGSAASGGFLGATIAYAFNRGVNRGLFSNEAGQGSAPIAHAAARTSEPVSEGLVAILEPFIDTIVICTLTGMTLLASGVWQEKIENKFQFTDVQVLAEKFDDVDREQRIKLSNHLLTDETLPLYNGELIVEGGNIRTVVSLIHARSLAENVQVFDKNDEVFTGKLEVENGQFVENSEVYLYGKSLIHSAPLTTEAFKRSFLGDAGQYIISIGLLLFAFSTAISWSYYGDRAMTYLFGSKSVRFYRVVYVLGFFVGAFADTTIIWTFSGITIALMTIPNLVGILILHKDMKNSIQAYWTNFKQAHPDEKTPE